MSETAGMGNIDIDRWKDYWRDANADTAWRAYHDNEDQQREQARAEILELVERFQSDSISIDEMRAEFDKRTRNEWDLFGLKGMSGAMFLNKLVKHIPDQDLLTTQFKAVISVPDDEVEAEARLGAFTSYLQEEIAQGNVTKGELQPARAPYLISGFWHMQDTEQWPIWYISGRRALAAEHVLQVTGNVNDDYFAFRRAFVEIATALNVSSWKCEHLLDWLDKKRVATTPQLPTIESPEPIVADEDGDSAMGVSDQSSHAQIQWLLAKIGHKVGCQVWIAANDQSKTWNGQKLGDLSIDALPNLGLDTWPQKTIGLIDVVWLKGKQIAAAFEVEHTTSIYSGLLRMSDLTVEVPNLSIPLYLVAPKARIDKVRRELNRPTFRKLEIQERCGFFSDEDLIAAADGMLKWASDPSAISGLAEFIGEASR
jgi:hypothetical protein